MGSPAENYVQTTAFKNTGAAARRLLPFYFPAFTGSKKQANKETPPMIFKTRGTCSSQIDLTVDEDHIIRSVAFTGGCNGNLKGISKLVTGRRAEEVIDILEGTTCGFKSTSCPDQLAKALRKAIAQG